MQIVNQVQKNMLIGLHSDRVTYLLQNQVNLKRLFIYKISYHNSQPPSSLAAGKPIGRAAFYFTLIPGRHRKQADGICGGTKKRLDNNIQPPNV